MKDVMFLGWGSDDQGVTHYRTKLPARALDADWVTFDNGRPVINAARSSKHEIIVIQNCWDPSQLKVLKDIQEGSQATMVANIDDWVKTIGKMKGKHGYADYFARHDIVDGSLRYLEMCDACFVSTPWLANKVKPYFDKDQVYLCRNMLDTDRYEAAPALERDSGVLLGWSGGTGHRGAFRSISQPVSAILKSIPEARFVSVGDDVGKTLEAQVHSRAHNMRWSSLEYYPRHMRMFDISLAPAESNDFYRAKSQLRLYESAILGTPLIAHPMYDEMQDGVHGFHAETPGEWYEAMEKLVRDDDLRAEMGKNMLELSKTFTVEARKHEWEEAIESVRRLREVQRTS